MRTGKRPGNGDRETTGNGRRETGAGGKRGKGTSHQSLTISRLLGMSRFSTVLLPKGRGYQLELLLNLLSHLRN